MTVKVDLAETLPVDKVELCIMLSNALENAVNACGRISDTKRRELRITCISRPELAIGIYNTYEGTVVIDESGLPVSRDDYHGYGTQSIRLFAQKYGAVLDFDADGTWFKVRVVFPPSPPTLKKQNPLTHVIALTFRYDPQIKYFSDGMYVGKITLCRASV